MSSTQTPTATPPTQADEIVALQHAVACLWSAVQALIEAQQTTSGLAGSSATAAANALSLYSPT